MVKGPLSHRTLRAFSTLRLVNFPSYYYRFFCPYFSRVHLFWRKIGGPNRGPNGHGRLINLSLLLQLREALLTFSPRISHYSKRKLVGEKRLHYQIAPQKRMGCSNSSRGLNSDMYPILIVTNDDVYRKCIAYWTPFFMMYLILSLFTCLIILLYVQALYCLRIRY